MAFKNIHLHYVLAVNPHAPNALGFDVTHESGSMSKSSLPVRCCPSGHRWVCWSRGPQAKSMRSQDQSSSLCSETFLQRARTDKLLTRFQLL